MRNWLIIIAIIVVAGLILAATVFKSTEGQFEITASPVLTAPIRMTIETSGTVEPLSTIEIGCEVTGKIIELPVDEDQPVKAGQIICRIDPELVAAEHEQSKADLAKAQSILADAKLALNEQTLNLPVLTQQALAQKQEAEANLVDAEYNWKRVDKLFQESNASEAEHVARKALWLRAQSTLTAATAAHQRAMNNEKVLLDRAKQAVEQAEAAQQLAQARLDFTQTRVDRCTIKSPIDGIVLKRYMDVGTTVNATFQTPPLFRLAPSLDKMRVKAKVSESDISHIEIGQTARFTIDARKKTTFEDKILFKRNQPEIIQNVVTYTVIFEVANPDRVLLPGLTVNVEIECVAKKSVPQIANAALRFKPPLSLDERRELIEAARAKLSPRPESDAAGNPARYASEAFVWQFDTAAAAWHVNPLWIGITDNVNSEILWGAKPGEDFVRRFIDKSSSGFSLKEALKLARPDQRTL